jgi:Xaa-Pro aminopeptidase
MSVYRERLLALRRHVASLALDGVIVPRADEFLGEDTPPSSQRLAWLTGFTGSSGVAVVLADRAAVFSDGRYVLQLAQQTDSSLWEQRHVVDDPPHAWLASHAAPGARIGYDPKLMAADALARFVEAGMTMVPLESNTVDAIWTDRPAPPSSPIVLHPLQFAGKPSAEKREEIASALRKSKQDAAMLTDPASVAWLLNLRGGDLPTTPFALAVAIIHADARVDLFADQARLAADLVASFGDCVTVRPSNALGDVLDALSGKRVRVDPAASPVWFSQRLRAAGAEVVAESDPCALPKTRKNAAEQQGMRVAHGRDAIAICRFLHWLDRNASRGTLTEMSAAAHLLALRAELPGFRSESFPAISGAGEHGAFIHYRATEASDRALQRNELYLIDSGAQYPDGTTDVTRTVWTGPAPPPDSVRADVTRVLKGHIAIATLAFPRGVAGPHIDAFARRALWDSGLDYDHGTGHGVGSYLSVHEGPAGLSRNAKPIPLESGMVLSNEPGLYRAGAYGIRLENLLLVEEAPSVKDRPWLRFATLTLAPFDRRLIDSELLDPAERTWLDGYHARVFAEVGPALPQEDREWLAKACAPLV